MRLHRHFQVGCLPCALVSRGNPASCSHRGEERQGIRSEARGGHGLILQGIVGNLERGLGTFAVPRLRSGSLVGEKEALLLLEAGKWERVCACADVVVGGSFAKPAARSGRRIACIQARRARHRARGIVATRIAWDEARGGFAVTGGGEERKQWAGVLR